MRLGSINVDEQLVLGMDGHAGEVGADLGAFAGVRVALGTLVFEDELAGGGVARLLRERQQLVEHFLPVGIGQAAAGFEQAAGAVGESGGRDDWPGPAFDRATGRRAAACLAEWR